MSTNTKLCNITGAPITGDMPISAASDKYKEPVLNLSEKAASEDEKQTGLYDLDEKQRNAIDRFYNLENTDANEADILIEGQKLAIMAKYFSVPEFPPVYISGPGYLTSVLERALKEEGLTVYYRL